MTIATHSAPRTPDDAPIARETGKADAPNGIPHDFVPGLAGVPAFTTEIAEPDRDGGALRYRGVNVEDLVAEKVEFGDVWALLVDGKFGAGLPPAERFELPVDTRDSARRRAGRTGHAGPDVALTAAAGHRRPNRT